MLFMHVRARAYVQLIIMLANERQWNYIRIYLLCVCYGHTVTVNEWATVHDDGDDDDKKEEDETATYKKGCVETIHVMWFVKKNAIKMVTITL